MSIFDKKIYSIVISDTLSYQILISGIKKCYYKTTYICSISLEEEGEDTLQYFSKL